MWVKIDDQFPGNPKILAVGPLAAQLYVCGLAYCAKHLTDGFIPSGAVRLLMDVDGIAVDGQPVTYAGLVEALTTPHGNRSPLWEKVPGGYQVHDYLECNPSRDQVSARREADLRRKTKEREKRRAGDDDLDIQINVREPDGGR